MNKYELGVIVRADLEDENFQTEMNRVKALIDRFGGTIDKIDEWGKRRLSYPIMKLTEGMYTFITFTSPADAPREIESRLRLMESVLRFLMIRKDEAEVPSKTEPIAKPKPEPTEAVESEAVGSEATESEAVESETAEPVAVEAEAVEA